MRITPALPYITLYIRTVPLEGRCVKREPRRELKSQTCRSPSSNPDNRQSHPINFNSYRNRCPTPTHTGTTKAKMSSTTQDMSWTVKQKSHTQQGIYMLNQLRYTNILTQSPLIWMINNLSQILIQMIKLNTDSVTSSIPKSENKHSFMDYQCTLMATISPPHNTEDTVSTLPTPHPRCLKTYPTLLPRPPNVINSNILKLDTNSTKPAARNCQKLVHREIPSCTYPQPTPKSPLLPTLPALVRQQIRKKLIPGPPLYRNSQYHYKQHISGLYSAINNKQCPPSLPSPPYQHTIQGSQKAIITGPHPHT